MKITTNQQFEMLVSEMGKNLAFAKGFRKGIKPLNFDSFWKKIAEKLNPFGPPVRDGDGWHKVWKDMKFKVKKKLVRNKAEIKATGGGVYKQLPLSPLEEMVANIMQFQKQVNPKGQVGGFGEEGEALLNEEGETPNLTSGSAENVELVTPAAMNISDDIPIVSNRGTSSKNKSAEKERITLLKKQTEIQQEQCSHLESIKVCLKDISRYQRKRFEIEEERLKILKRKTRREEELMDLDASIKRKKLEILEKQLISH